MLSQNERTISPLHKTLDILHSNLLFVLNEFFVDSLRP